MRPDSVWVFEDLVDIGAWLASPVPTDLAEQTVLKAMDFKLRVNRKQIASTKNPERNQQFLYIGEQRERFVNQGLPIISVDAKKTEQVGNFENAGAKWDRETVLVKDHDFRSEADGLAIPYGIYDTQASRGAMFVGASHNTPPFAIDAIAQWWL